MFSRKERDFLTLIVRSAEEGEPARKALLTQFPNPVYRRKLLWGIRRKATGAAADWELYARAARVEARVLPGSLPSGPVPLAADPIVTVFRQVRSLLRPAPGRPRRPPPEGGPGTGERP